MHKKCTKCGEVKSQEDFYAHSKMADGRLSKCKTCTKRDVRENRASKLEYYKAYDVARDTRPDRVAARAEYQKTDSGRAASTRAKKRFIEKNPVKRSAHIAVGNALRNGILSRRPCEKCGEQKSQAHHDDYGKPLDVRWLCTKHHAEWHRHNEPIVPVV